MLGGAAQKPGTKLNCKGQSEPNEQLKLSSWWLSEIFQFGHFRVFANSSGFSRKETDLDSACFRETSYSLDNCNPSTKNYDRSLTYHFKLSSSIITKSKETGRLIIITYMLSCSQPIPKYCFNIKAEICFSKIFTSLHFSLPLHCLRSALCCTLRAHLNLETNIHPEDLHLH